jgi:glucose-1-phosphate adenylyltransferase
MGNYLFEPHILEQALEEGVRRGDTDFGRDLLPHLCQRARVYAYDFADNRVPGLQDYEEPAYWRDVGTLSALAAAQQDAMGHRPRFNLWNRRWPIRGEHKEPAAQPAVQPTGAALRRAASRDLRSDERLPTS